MARRDSNDAERPDSALSPDEVPSPVAAADDDELPVEVEADFKPLDEVGGKSAEDAAEGIDPFQYDSLQAQEAFGRGRSGRDG
jgi:hypothetical protein